MNAVRMDTLSGRVTRTSYPALASCFLAVFLSLLLSSGAQIMFSSANAISSNSTSTNPGTVAPGDLNHDGYTDVVVRIFALVCASVFAVSVVFVTYGDGAPLLYLYWT